MSNEVAGSDGVGNETMLSVPVVDVHMEQVPVPPLPALPALPPVPSLDEILGNLRNIQLPTFPPPEQAYSGVPAPPPLDLAQLLQPLSSINQLFGSGLVDELSSLSGTSGGSGNGISSIISDISTLARPLDIVQNSGNGLMGQFDRGDRAVSDLEQSWDSQGGEAAVAQGRQVEASKKGVKAQGDAITQYTREATVIVSNAKAQIAAVQTRLSGQLVALAPTAATPPGQAAVVAAIAEATAESEAIVASAKTQLIGPTTGVTAAADPVPTPAMSNSEMPGQTPRGGNAQQTTAMTQASGRAEETVSGDSTPSGVVGALTGNGKPASVLEKAKAAVSLAQKLSNALPVPGGGKSQFSASGSPRSSNSHTTAQGSSSFVPKSSSIPTSSGSGESKTAAGSSAGASSGASHPGGAAAGSATVTSASNALPTYTASAEAATAAPSQGPAGSASSTPKAAVTGQTGAIPMMPMGGMGGMAAAGSGAAGAGGGRATVSTPEYLVTAANGEEILGEQFDVSPGVIGSHEVRESPAQPLGEKDSDSTHLNLH